jgi:hypothetical protein
MIKVVYDLDGVLRNLYPIVRRRFGLWQPKDYFEWDRKGYNIYNLVEKDYSILVDAKPSKYVKIVEEQCNILNGKCLEIWSYQPKDWINPTTAWISKYFSNPKARWLLPAEKYHRLMKEKNTILVDDYPNHPEYSRIWLIDQPYNQKVKAEVRIKTVEDLRERLRELK